MIIWYKKTLQRLTRIQNNSFKPIVILKFRLNRQKTENVEIHFRDDKSKLHVHGFYRFMKIG